MPKRLSGSELYTENLKKQYLDLCEHELKASYYYFAHPQKYTIEKINSEFFANSISGEALRRKLHNVYNRLWNMANKNGFIMSDLEQEGGEEN